MDRTLDTPRVKEPRKGRKPHGRHPDKRLSAMSIRHAKPGRYADGNGLYLFVEPSGAKRWVLRVAVNGKRRDMGLGSAQIVTLADARAEAMRLRKIARVDKGDPLAARRRAQLEQRGMPTFKEAATQVHARDSEVWRNAKHKAQWLASLEADVFPAIGDRPVNAIERSDLLKLLEAVWTKKPATARRLKQRIRVVFKWAKGHNYRGDNPCDDIAELLPTHRDKQQHHPAMAYQDVPAFITELRTAYATHSVRLALESLILTATRTNEVQGAMWPELDLEAKVWTVPAIRMKSGVDHRVPLSTRMVEIFTEARTRAGDSKWIFPGSKPGQPLSNMTFLKALRKLRPGPLTTHGFRSSFRDWCAEKTNSPQAVCEAALAHVLRDKTEAAYNRTDLFDRRRSLMDAWTRFATSKPGDVVSIGA